MPGEYVPDAGDIVWLHFDPQLGREQAGHRPALVLSPASYNGKTDLMLCCPVTHQIKRYPFKVVIDAGVPSAVLTDQVKSLDWVQRKASFKGKVPAVILADVRRKVHALIGRP